jgi:Wntless-like, transmembrane domain
LQINQRLDLIAVVGSTRSGVEEIDKTIEAHVRVRARSIGNEWQTIEQDAIQTIMLHCPLHSSTCAPVHILRENAVSHSQYQVTVRIGGLSSQENDKVTFVSRTISAEFAETALVAQYIMVLLMCFVTLSFVRRVNRITHEWTHQQVALCLLLSSTIAFNNPTYVLQLSFVTPTWVVLASVYKAVFFLMVIHHSFLYYDGIRNQLRQVMAQKYEQPMERDSTNKTIATAIVGCIVLIGAIVQGMHETDNPVYQASQSMSVDASPLWLLCVVSCACLLVWLVYCAARLLNEFMDLRQGFDTQQERRELSMLEARFYFFSAVTTMMLLAIVRYSWYWLQSGEPNGPSAGEFFALLIFSNMYTCVTTFTNFPYDWALVHNLDVDDDDFL